MIKRVLIWKQNDCQNGRQKGRKLLIPNVHRIFSNSLHMGLTEKSGGTFGIAEGLNVVNPFQNLSSRNLIIDRF